MNTPRSDSEAIEEPFKNSLAHTHLETDSADRYVADSRGEEAIESARRRRWARQVLEQSITVLATLQASLGQQLVLILRSGERRVVQVAMLGENFLQVRTAGSITWIRLDCVICVETDVAVAATPEAFEPGVGRLEDVLEDLVADELPISLSLLGGSQITGVTISVGAAVRVQVSGTSRVAVINLEHIEMILLPIRPEG